jgi:hypothetical protein
MASLTFEAFGQKFRTASTAAYIIMVGPHDIRKREYDAEKRELVWDGKSMHHIEAYVHGYAYSLGAAQKRVRQLAGVPHAIISLATGKEVR